MMDEYFSGQVPGPYRLIPSIQDPVILIDGLGLVAFGQDDRDVIDEYLQRIYFRIVV